MRQINTPRILQSLINIAEYARFLRKGVSFFANSTSLAKGFTLIELLVVIAIIGILATVVLVAINPAARIAEARNSQRQSDLGDLKTALEAYATAHNGLYPALPAGVGGACEDCVHTGYLAMGPDNWIPGLVSEGFIKHLPKDPNDLVADKAFYPNGMPPDNDYAAYVYFPSGDHKNYKVLDQYTMPKSVLNATQGVDKPPSPGYCNNASLSPPDKYTDQSFTETPGGNPAYKLKSFADPMRYDHAYSIYSTGYTCW